MLRAAADLLLPPSCAGCGEPGAPCCPRCRSQFGELVSVAGRGAVTPAGEAAGTEIYALAGYRGAARALVLAYKERGRRDLAPVLGAVLAEACMHLSEDCRAGDGALWLVPAPSRRTASQLRGGPHMLVLARWCAAGLAKRGRAAAVAPALRLAAGVRDAAGLDPAQRAANLDGRMWVTPDGVPSPGTPVVVLDDVVTTGATASACADALRAAGVAVKAVIALTSPSR